MSFDGGFGVTAYARETLVNSVVQAAHYRHGDQFRVALRQAVTLAGVAFELSGTLFVEAPSLTLRAADKKARVSLSGWARVRLQAPGIDEACVVRLTAELLVPIALDGVEDGWDKLFLDLSQFDVVSAAIGVPWTSARSGGHASALKASAPFLQLLLDAVRPTAKKLLRVSVPIERLAQMQANLAVQELPFVPRIRLQAVSVLDGAFAACFDVFSGPTRETQGDLAALQQPWDQWGISTVGAASGGSSLQAIVAIQPGVLLKWGGMNIKFQIRKTPIEEGKRVDDVVLGLAPGAATLFVKVTIIRDDPFPDDHVQVLVSFAPMGQFIKILKTDVVLNSAGIAGFVDLATGLATDYVRSVVSDKLVSAGFRINWALSGAKYKGPLPGAEGAPGHALVQVTPAATAIDPAFVLSGLDVRFSRAHGTSSGFDDPADEPAVLPTVPALVNSPPEPFKVRRRLGLEDPALFWPIRARVITFQLPRHPTLRRDPSLRTVWSLVIKRQDDSTFEFLQDRWSDEPGADTLSIDLWSPDFYPSERIDMRCAHYRPPQNPAAALAPAATSRTYITDRFRRDRPFVRWHRDVAWQVEEDGQDVVKSKIRESAVHKTDIRERCQFCDTGGLTRAFNSAEQMQHLLSLPAPAEDNFRAALCAYCFPAHA